MAGERTGKPCRFSRHKVMKVPNSPLTGKPMRVVYMPDKVKYRGEEYACVYVSFHDDETGESFTTTESDSIWFRQVTNQYRERHGIPYADEIAALRKWYGISASKMALILGFGANQYRLYEEGEVPSESNGKMIRSAMNPRVFMDLVRSSKHQLTEKEFSKLTSRMEEIVAKTDGMDDEQWLLSRIFLSGRGQANGFAPQAVARLKNLLLYVLGTMGETFQTKMNKVLFYIDFLSYRERGMAISGLAYQAIEFGPVPQRWDRVYSSFDDVEQHVVLVQNQECLALDTDTPADMSMFSAEELAIIDTVCTKMKDMTSRKATTLSHEEPAWKNHHTQPGIIPFDEAFNLRLFE